MLQIISVSQSDASGLSLLSQSPQSRVQHGPDASDVAPVPECRTPVYYYRISVVLKTAAVVISFVSLVLVVHRFQP